MLHNRFRALDNYELGNVPYRLAEEGYDQIWRPLEWVTVSPDPWSRKQASRA
jgi:hypothetical protein